MARNGALFVGAALATLAVAFGTGVVLARMRVLPGAVAVWGSAPGLATAMVLMARDSGADYRLVAFMTYLRMLMVAIGATVLSLVLGAHGGGTAPAPAPVHDPWFWPIDLHGALASVGVCVVGAFLGRLVRLPAGDLLGPLILGTVLNIAGLIPHLALPQIVLAAAYMIVGWGIGARFTPQTIQQARAALLPVAISVLAMISGCFCLGLALHWATGVDIPTAYLATSPGGMAAIAVIAASSPVNVAFVLTLQTVRMAAILLFGPAIARAVAKRFA
ncbi:AbrB family transcriptional regulator [Novosphingobium sp. 9]|uniref:AbrB family transcriptional regulator n=1 Tax=Novosphingobium sp. 9 TaxID=2025349 RepID=UPI0021B5D9FC|nr:AbrB family transcriptional regulator [Novosphingobium sp. 9]